MISDKIEQCLVEVLDTGTEFSGDTGMGWWQSFHG